MNTTTIGATGLHRAIEQCALNVAEAIVRALFHFAALRIASNFVNFVSSAGVTDIDPPG
jgi:hypothetical protein